MNILLMSFCGLALGSVSMAIARIERSSPVGSYAVELSPGDQAVGVTIVNHPVLSATIVTTAGNLLTTSGATLNAQSVLTPTSSYYVEAVHGPAGPADAMVGHRLEVDVAATIAASSVGRIIVVDVTSKRSTLGGTADLAGYRVELREHVTLNQIFPKGSLYPGTNFSRADQVQFFNGNGFDICYLYGSSNGPRQWIGLGSFASQDGRVIAPGEGVIFRRSALSPGKTTIFITGRVRTTPFVQPLSKGHNFVAEGFPVACSFLERQARPAAYKNGDRVKLLRSAGSVTYRLYSRGTAPDDNAWVAQGDTSFKIVNQLPIFEYRSAAFLQLSGSDIAHRYQSPFLESSILP